MDTRCVTSSPFPLHILASRLFSETSQVQLLIYFMLKFAMEILLSESSVVTTFYFKWTTSTVAIFLAVLGLTVLPVNVIVGSYVTNLFQDRYVHDVRYSLTLKAGPERPSDQPAFC
jgi:hypothetical protein